MEELRAQLASTKEILEADIKGKEQVCSTLTIFIAGGFNVKELANFFYFVTTGSIWCLSLSVLIQI